MRVLITGASGFIGRCLCEDLLKKHPEVEIIAITRESSFQLNNIKVVQKEIDGETDWKNYLIDVQIIIHLAGRAHILNELVDNPYEEFAKANIDATKNLAIQAVNSGVKRFIFISSIGVNGNSSQRPFTELDFPNPREDYALTKKYAEDELIHISRESDMETVIIRPPLVYGNIKKGNFAKLRDICNIPVPLPFGNLNNKRSLIYVENLVSFIITCIFHPSAAGQTFLVSDDEDVSTSTLIYTIRKYLGMPSLLFTIPQSWIVSFLNLIGKQNLVTRLCGNLQVDITKAKTLLGWKPPFTFEEGIQRTIQEK